MYWVVGVGAMSGFVKRRGVGADLRVDKILR